MLHYVGSLFAEVSIEESLVHKGFMQMQKKYPAHAIQVVVLLLLTFCLLLLPLWESVTVLCFVVRVHSGVAIILMGRGGGRAGCFAWSVFLVPRGWLSGSSSLCCGVVCSL